MTMTELFRNFGSLFEYFQYWSILLIIGVVVTVFPLNNFVYKKYLTGNLVRLGKLCGFLSVYVISVIYILIFTLITKVATITIGYLIGSTLALGFCSQAVWEFIKIIRDYGFKKFVLWVISKLEKEHLITQFAERYNVDKKIVKILITEIENVTDEELENPIEESLKFRNKLGAFLESDNLEDAIKELLTIVK